MKNRKFRRLTCVILATACIIGGAAAEAPAQPDAALDRLSDANTVYLQTNDDAELRQDLAENGQHPYAVIITCSDSRVVPERVFNAGFGEIFTIRTAGNVVSAFEIGSAEYGVEHLGAPLIVVMGHTRCGAVTAALEAEPGEAADDSIADIVDEILPSVAEAEVEGADEATLLDEAILNNVSHSIEKLRTSEILRTFEAEGKLRIVGAIYNIETGEVIFLDH